MMNTDETYHIKFDRYLHAKKPSYIPSSTIRRLKYSILTAYTTTICLIGSHYWKWAGIVTYLTPVISAISAALYFGCWQLNLKKTITGSVVGSVIGTLIGLTYKYTILQVFLIFITITWCNKCSVWEHSTKVYCGLSIVVASFWPTLLNGQQLGWIAFRSIVALSCVPHLLTGITLLFPIPVMASEAVKSNLSLITRQVSAMTYVLTKGFCAPDFQDLHSVEFDELLREIKHDLDIITTLQTYIECEAMLFPWLSRQASTLKLFLQIMPDLIHELTSLKEILKGINNNYTQSKFVESMSEPLEDISAEITLIMRLLCDCMCTIVTPESVIKDKFMSVIIMISSAFSNISAFRIRTQDLETSSEGNDSTNVRVRNLSIYSENSWKWIPSDDSVQNRIKEITNLKGNSDKNIDDNYYEMKFNESVKRLQSARVNLITAYVNTRNYIWDRPSVMKIISSNRLIIDTLTEYDAANAFLPKYSKAMSQSEDSNNIEDSPAYTEYKILLEENRRAHNLYPRGAYIHHLQRACDELNRFSVVFEILSNAKCSDSEGFIKSLLSYTSQAIYSLAHVVIQSMLLGGILYVYNCWKDLANNFIYWSDRLFVILSERFHLNTSATNSNHSWFSKADRKIMHHIFNIYKTPFKIGLATIIASIFVIRDGLGNFNQNGLWAVVVIAFIRQDTTTSSFLIGYQRVEGTVMGAVYAFSTYEALKCEQIGEVNSCNNLSIIVPVIVTWLTVCAFFREGPRHGYASMVAGYTPIVLYLTPSNGTSGLPWNRVEKTFIGVAIYLLIENCILPYRTDVAIRKNVIFAIDETTILFNELMSAVDSLMILNNFSLPGQVFLNDVEENAIQGSTSQLVALDSNLPNASIRVMFEEADELAAKVENVIRNDYEESFDVDTDTSLIQNIESLNDTLRQQCLSTSIDTSFNNVQTRSKSFSIQEQGQDAISVERNESMTTIENLDPFKNCLIHLSLTNESIVKLNNILIVQQKQLLSVVYEPTIWQKAFPQPTYLKLLESFQNILQSSRIVTKGTADLRKILMNMVKNGENFKLQFSFYDFMSKRILKMAPKTCLALKLTSLALKRYD